MNRQIVAIGIMILLTLLPLVSFGRVTAMVADVATASYYQRQDSIVNRTVAGSIAPWTCPWPCVRTGRC